MALVGCPGSAEITREAPAAMPSEGLFGRLVAACRLNNARGVGNLLSPVLFAADDPNDTDRRKRVQQSLLDSLRPLFRRCVALPERHYEVIDVNPGGDVINRRVVLTAACTPMPGADRERAMSTGESGAESGQSAGSPSQVAKEPVPLLLHTEWLQIEGQWGLSAVILVDTTYVRPTILQLLPTRGGDQRAAVSTAIDRALVGIVQEEFHFPTQPQRRPADLPVFTPAPGDIETEDAAPSASP